MVPALGLAAAALAGPIAALGLTAAAASALTLTRASSIDHLLAEGAQLLRVELTVPVAIQAFDQPLHLILCLPHRTVTAAPSSLALDRTSGLTLRLAFGWLISAALGPTLRAALLCAPLATLSVLATLTALTPSRLG